MSENFRIRICSDLDYEEMVADIVWNDTTVAMIIQESGSLKMIIKIFQPVEKEHWEFSLNEFLQAIDSAKKKLNQMKKNSEDL